MILNGHGYRWEVWSSHQPAVSFYTVPENGISTQPCGVNIIEGELPSEREQGCWRLNMGANAEVKPEIVSYKFDVELEPGDTHTITHQIYYNGPDGSCFPAPEYHTEVSIEIVNKDGESSDQTYDITLTVEDEFVITLKPLPDTT